MTDSTPEVITRYLRAAGDKDVDALVACFTEDATVVDEGRTHHGRDEIRRWREETGSAWTYTVTVLGSEPLGDGRYRMSTHLAGDFPGGQVDLNHGFTLRDGLIAALSIAE